MRTRILPGNLLSHRQVLAKGKTMNQQTISKQSVEPLWMKISTVAALCDTTNQTVINWAKKGLLKQTGTGKKLQFITRASFEKFIEKHG